MPGARTGISARASDKVCTAAHMGRSGPGCAPIPALPANAGAALARWAFRKHTLATSCSGSIAEYPRASQVVPEARFEPYLEVRLG